MELGSYESASAESASAAEASSSSRVEQNESPISKQEQRIGNSSIRSSGIGIQQHQRELISISISAEKQKK
jgi:hypothetical protein